MGLSSFDAPLIQAKNLFHCYGKHKTLQNVSLEIEAGQCFALLGPNGAGKTTFVKLLLGLEFPTAGEVKLFGEFAGAPHSRQSVGYLPDRFSFYPYYTVKDTLAFYAAMVGLEGEQVRSSIVQALDKLKISNLSDRKLSKLSKGQLQRVGLASLLLGDKKIIILDEPFSGLDPIGIKDLKELLHEFKSQGRTLLINSHILAEVEPLCDYFGILNGGQLIVAGEKNSLLSGRSLESFFAENVQ